MRAGFVNIGALCPAIERLEALGWVIDTRMLVLSGNVGDDHNSDPIDFKGAVVAHVKVMRTGKQRANVRSHHELMSGLPQVRTPGGESCERAIYQVFKLLAENRDALLRFVAKHRVKQNLSVPVYHPCQAVRFEYVAATSRDFDAGAA